MRIGTAGQLPGGSISFPVPKETLQQALSCPEQLEGLRFNTFEDEDDEIFGRWRREVRISGNQDAANAEPAFEKEKSDSGIQHPPTPSPTPSNTQLLPLSAPSESYESPPDSPSNQLLQEQASQSNREHEYGLTREIGLNLDESNIIDQPRRRIPRNDPFFQSYFTIDDIVAYNFAAAQEQSKPLERTHRSQLSIKPEHWKDAIKHRFKDEQIEAPKVEIKALESMGTFEIVEDPRKHSQIQ